MRAIRRMREKMYEKKKGANEGGSLRTKKTKKQKKNGDP